MALSEQLNTQEWLVEESAFQIAKLNFYETIFTVGNGYQGTRGSLEEGTKGERSGTLLSGIFDHHDSTVIDLVNAPSWLPLTLWAEGTRLDMQTCKVLEHRRALDLRTGVLYRLTRFEDTQGRISARVLVTVAKVVSVVATFSIILITPSSSKNSRIKKLLVSVYRRTIVINIFAPLIS